LTLSKQYQERKMKIAVIYHSQTGNTEKLAKYLETSLTGAGHSVTPVKLQTDVEVKSGTRKFMPPFNITNLPNLSEFDAVCVGGPVWAFGPSPVIFKAASQLENLKGKKVLPFVTMGFPCPAMGGKGAIKHLSQALKDKGAEVLPGIIIPRMWHKYERDMQKAAESVIPHFQE
jgi:flavodoxin